MTRTQHLAALAMVLAVAACGRRPLIYEYQPVATQEWNATDTLRFHTPPAPRAGRYAVSVGLRASDMVAWRDVWLVLESRTRQNRHRDTLHIILASDRARWHTRGNVLHETEQSAAVLNLDSAQEAQLLVYHIMAHQALKGLTEVGVKAMALDH
ncbi:MAG: hypothetical protein IJS59_10660 [Bacteroidaceae bacterium]|nr:hypothetical protein [Bacteroidaceae bacterium]